MSRKRRSKKKSNQSMVAVIAIGGVALALTYIFCGGFGKNFNPTVFGIVFTILVVLIIGITILLKTATVKGSIGELKVHNKLESMRKRIGGYLYHNVMVEDENGKTSQIDHIFLCKYGIFVVETKNYAGRIYGDDSQQNWTQVLNYGNTKNQFYNPVKQNATHIYRLKDKLGYQTFHSIIVFIKADISNVHSSYTYHLRDLKHIIDEKEPVLDDSAIEGLSKKIQYLVDHPPKTNREHIDEIHENDRNINNNICPRCGGKLVLRTASQTGRSFYGCSNYPQCKFTKRAD